jgi:hypothetical protein
MLKPIGRPTLPWPWALLLLSGFIGAFGVLSVHLGQNADFDLRNYHLYNAFQFLHDRFYLDLNAAGYQSFFNPLLDVPYYTLATVALPNAPRLVAFIMGGYDAAMALAVVLIAQRVTSPVKTPRLLGPWSPPSTSACLAQISFPRWEPLSMMCQRGRSFSTGWYSYCAL